MCRSFFECEQAKLPVLTYVTLHNPLLCPIGVFTFQTAAVGREEAEVVREALAQYLRQTDPEAIKGVIADFQERMTSLERKLAGLDRLVS